MPSTSRERVKGRKTSGRFALIPDQVLRSPALATADHGALRVLIVLAAAYTGSNNGALGLTRSQAGEYGIRSSDTLRRSLAQLEDRGLILRTFQGSRQPPKPAMFAITWRSLDDTPHTKETRVATNDWKRWPESVAA